MTISSWRSPPSATRATPSMSSAIRIAGKESCTSATRDERVEAPANVTGEQSQGHAEHHGERHRGEPMPSEMRAPCMMVERMSRPWLSLPRGKARSPPSSQAGGLKAAFRSSAAASNGFCGEIHGENAAAPTQTSVSAAAAMVTGDLEAPREVVVP